MTCEEFSNEFDNLLNSYSRSAIFGKSNGANSIELDEYEKSLFLTLAQEELIQEYYTGKNPFFEGYEKTEEIRRYLASLVKSYETNESVTIKTGLSDNSVFFKLPEDVWFIVYEAVTYSDPNVRCSAQTVEVKPMSHDSFNYQMNNPFKRPNKSRVFRMDIESEMVEIVTKYSIDHYLMRYITQPSPIILVDLGELSINNINKKTECELNSTLHRAILKRAVDIALRRFNVANN